MTYPMANSQITVIFIANFIGFSLKLKTIRLYHNGVYKLKNCREKLWKIYKLNFKKTTNSVYTVVKFLSTSISTFLFCRQIWFTLINDYDIRILLTLLNYITVSFLMKYKKRNFCTFLLDILNNTK